MSAVTPIGASGSSSSSDTQSIVARMMGQLQAASSANLTQQQMGNVVQSETQVNNELMVDMMSGQGKSLSSSQVQGLNKELNAIDKQIQGYNSSQNSNAGQDPFSSPSSSGSPDSPNSNQDQQKQPLGSKKHHHHGHHGASQTASSSDTNPTSASGSTPDTCGQGQGQGTPAMTSMASSSHGKGN